MEAFNCEKNCPFHPEEELISYCETCEMRICTLCLQFHEEHLFSKAIPTFPSQISLENELISLIARVKESYDECLSKQKGSNKKYIYFLIENEINNLWNEIKISLFETLRKVIYSYPLIQSYTSTQEALQNSTEMLGPLLDELNSLRTVESKSDSLTPEEFTKHKSLIDEILINQTPASKDSITDLAQLEEDIEKLHIEAYTDTHLEDFKLPFNSLLCFTTNSKECTPHPHSLQDFEEETKADFIISTNTSNRNPPSSTSFLHQPCVASPLYDLCDGNRKSDGRFSEKASLVQMPPFILEREDTKLSLKNYQNNHFQSAIRKELESDCGLFCNQLEFQNCFIDKIQGIHLADLLKQRIDFSLTFDNCTGALDELLAVLVPTQSIDHVSYIGMYISVLFQFIANSESLKSLEIRHIFKYNLVESDTLAEAFSKNQNTLLSLNLNNMNFSSLNQDCFQNLENLNSLQLINCIFGGEEGSYEVLSSYFTKTEKLQCLNVTLSLPCFQHSSQFFHALRGNRSIKQFICGQNFIILKELFDSISQNAELEEVLLNNCDLESKTDFSCIGEFFLKTAAQNFKLLSIKGVLESDLKKVILLGELKSMCEGIDGKVEF